MSKRKREIDSSGDSCFVEEESKTRDDSDQEEKHVEGQGDKGSSVCQENVCASGVSNVEGKGTRQRGKCRKKKSAVVSRKKDKERKRQERLKAKEVVETSCTRGIQTPSEVETDNQKNDENNVEPSQDDEYVDNGSTDFSQRIRNINAYYVSRYGVVADVQNDSLTNLSSNKNSDHHLQTSREVEADNQKNDEKNVEPSQDDECVDNGSTDFSQRIRNINAYYASRYGVVADIQNDPLTNLSSDKNSDHHKYIGNQGSSEAHTRRNAIYRMKYHADPVYRENKKKSMRERYRQDSKVREKKMMDLNKKYLDNETFRTNIKLQNKVQNKVKYNTDVLYKEHKKEYVRMKYRTDVIYKEKKKEHGRKNYRTQPTYRKLKILSSVQKYKRSGSHRQSLKAASRHKYRSNLTHRHRVIAANKKKYKESATFREKVKAKLRNQYEKHSEIRVKKIKMVSDRRKQEKKVSNNIALLFQQQVSDGPKFICCVCHKFKFRKQIIICDINRYKKKGKKSHLMAKRCISYKYATKCDEECAVNCEILDHNKTWICYTCHYNLLKGEMPADAVENNMQLQEIPDELKHLNSLEKQLLALRIPFMKLISLPKGQQKGVIGPCVSVPTDIQKANRVLPHAENDSEFVKVKLKRKLKYKGHSQYEYVSPAKIRKGLQYLQENNAWYEDTLFNEDWENPVEGRSSSSEDRESRDQDGDLQSQDADKDEGKESTDCEDSDPSLKDKGMPLDTCLQPADIGQEILDQYFDGIFCVAPGENKTPVSMLKEVGNEAMSFPAQYPNGTGTYDEERSKKLTRLRYFHSRLFNVDSRFASDTQYLFYAQYLSELEQVVSQVSIALRKGTTAKASGTNLTAETIRDPETLNNLLKTDQGYKFLSPVRGTPPYWQATLKDLFAMIRQLGIPTWFCTFSAAEMRWTDMIGILLEQQGSVQSAGDLDWLEKCRVLANNPVMNAVAFDHRFHTLLKYVIIDQQVIGKVKDHFHRIEFQQRGSPHTHCLFWIKDAPLLDKDDDSAVCSFVDKYVSCALPTEEEDSELHGIVNSVQQHSKGHSKSCKKKGDTCRFHFPRPPSERTFISRPQSVTDPSCEASPQQMINEAKNTLQTLWAVINNTDLEEITTSNLFAAAGITQEKYEEATNVLTKRTSVVLKRSPTDSWTNQYNPTLLRCWDANMDIQYVTDAYSCVMYIISYISKAEREMGLVLDEARKEAAEGNLDAQNAMKKIGAAYFHQREVSAQEAAYRVCGLHLKECSRKVQFIPVGKDPVKMSKPLCQIQKKSNDMDDDDIWMISVIDRYRARPLGKQFEVICLATFCSQYRVLASSQVPKDISNRPQVFQLLNNLGFIQKRTRSDVAVIRYPRFSPKKDSELYYKANLQLFLPHRNNQQLKPDSFETFEEFYNTGAVRLTPSSCVVAVKTIVEENRQEYEVNAEALDNAEELFHKVGPLEDAWAMIAPESESSRLESEMEREQHKDINEDDDMEIPELASTQTSSGNEYCVEMSSHVISSNEALPLLRSLNKEQKLIFYNVRQWCLDKINGKHPEPFHVFITGGAGTGKSHLIKCLYYEAQKILSPSASNPDDTVVLLTAPTGTAAFNIGGTTLHQAFQLPQYLSLPYKHMRDEKLNTLRCKLQSLNILIIDEISMVGQPVLTYVHERLRQIKQTGNALFGNVCIIAVGDFYQLPPVKQTTLYNLNPKKFFPLWSSTFSVVELHKIMRQRDDAPFADLLNRVRVRCKEEKLDPADVACLKSCEKKDYDPSTLHIFATNGEVDSHNQEMISTVCSECQTFSAQDFDKNVTTGRIARRETPYNTSSDYLSRELVLAKDARVMLTRNVDVSDGLVNGVIGTVNDIIPPKPGSSDSSQILVTFDNSKIGLKHAHSASSHLPDGKHTVAIKTVEETLPNNAVRYQFPLRLAWACTVHKVQGITTKDLVISFEKIFAPGMAYVALSRVTSIQGLVIKNFDGDKIYCVEQISEAIERMPYFLKNEDIVPVTQNTVKILYHNIQGLSPHISDLRANADITDADFICLTETWLEQDSNIPELHQFQFKHHTRFASYSSSSTYLASLQKMKHGGVGVFHSQNKHFQEVCIHPCNIEAVAFHVPEINATVVVVYRPEVYKLDVFLKCLEQLLSKLPVHTSTVIVGDFNQDLLKNSTSVKNLMTTLGYQQLVNAATTDGATLIDHVYMKGNITVHTEIVHTYYSYHNMISLSLSSN